MPTCHSSGPTSAKPNFRGRYPPSPTETADRSSVQNSPRGWSGHNIHMCCRLIFCALTISLASAAEAPQTDLLIYGCTSGAITAAVQAKRMSKSVIMVCPERHLGGLTAGGLGWTDSGDKAVIGGLSREFYHRVWKEYDKPAAWRWQKRE